MKPNLSAVYQIRNAGSGQFFLSGQFYRTPVPIAIGMQKLRHGVLHAGTLRSVQGLWLKYRDPSLRSGLTGVNAPPTLSAHTRNR